MHLAIIGNGVTGVTAATRIRQKQPNWNITLISGESTYHYSRPALMYIFMGHLTYQQTKPFEDSFWEEQRIILKRDWVTGIASKDQQLFLHRSPPMAYDKLLIATGSKSNKFGWPGQNLEGVQGLYSLLDLQKLYENVRHTKKAVIVGGGLIGIELAEMLHSRNIEVTFVIRESAYWDNILPAEEAGLIIRVIEAQGIRLIRETQVKEMVDNGAGRVCAVITDSGERIDCELVGLTVGVSPNIDLLKDSQIETNRGVLVDRSFRTSVPEVFAAGDCAEMKSEAGERNLIQQVWYTGKKQGEVAGSVIAGAIQAYDPGVWYNSAKFFDLEYQVYGQVNLHVPGEKNLYWESPSGKQAFRIVYTDQGVIGFNFMGIRGRHQVCERWIQEKRSLDEVLDRLEETNFDPEFFHRYEPVIRQTLKEQAA